MLYVFTFINIHHIYNKKMQQAREIFWKSLLNLFSEKKQKQNKPRNELILD